MRQQALVVVKPNDVRPLGDITAQHAANAGRGRSGVTAVTLPKTWS